MEVTRHDSILHLFSHLSFFVAWVWFNCGFAFAVVVTLFIVAVVVICLFGFIWSIRSFIDNQRIFTELYTEAANSIASSVPPKIVVVECPDMAYEILASQIRDDTTVQNAINYLERLMQIQRTATNNDVMAFLFSTLSAILVGLCAALTLSSHKNVKKSDDSLVKTEKMFEKAEKELLKAEGSYRQALTYTVSVMNIHVDIIHAKSSILSRDKIGANGRIFSLHSMIKKLTTNVDSEIIRKLIQELWHLITAIKELKEYANGLPDGNAKISLHRAVSNYEEWTNDAIAHCDKLLR